MKTKHEVLLEKGYESIKGYTFDYEKSPDYNSIVITKEEIVEFLKEEPKQYYWRKDFELVLTEDDAWDDLYDLHCSEYDLDVTMDEFDKLMGVK